MVDVPSPETIRTIRAIMALERIGTADARAVLEALAGGAPGARDGGSERILATANAAGRKNTVIAFALLE